MTAWQLRGCDVLLNGFQALERRAFPDVTAFLVRFLSRITVQHPCDLKSRSLTKIGFDGDGDRFLLMLPHGWYVVFRVVPNCRAKSGTVEFLDATRFPDDLQAL